MRQSTKKQRWGVVPRDPRPVIMAWCAEVFEQESSDQPVVDVAVLDSLETRGHVSMPSVVKECHSQEAERKAMQVAGNLSMKEMKY